jgi:transcriptional regulator with XRE-family HTH domain
METAPTLPVVMATRAQSKAERELGVTLGKRIAALRKERGFTQVEIAKLLGISQAVVSNYEIGRVRPHPDVLIKLAELLQVSTDEIFRLKFSGPPAIV